MLLVIIFPFSLLLVYRLLELVYKAFINMTVGKSDLLISAFCNFSLSYKILLSYLEYCYK